MAGILALSGRGTRRRGTRDGSATLLRLLYNTVT
jgi:hypothetical protein